MSYDLILHIPHSSSYIPDEAVPQYLDPDLLQQNMATLTDWYTDELFDFSPQAELQTIVFPYSRFYCDVERYRDDEHEPMAKQGMGVIYSKGVIDQRIIRKVNDPLARAEIYRHYDAHHAAVRQAIQHSVAKGRTPLLIDAHSFADTIHANTSMIDSHLPDICIGHNRDSSFDPDLVKPLVQFFESKGFDVAVNSPYSGSLSYPDLPMKSLMIELNKRIYMNEDGSKSKNFEFVKECVEEGVSKI